MALTRFLGGRDVQLDSFTRFVSEHKFALLGGTAVLGSIYALKTLVQSRRLPPGPMALPFTGATRVLKNGISGALLKLKEQYGGIVCLSMGGDRCWVILNNYDIVKEAYVDRGSEFMDRTCHPVWAAVDFQDELFFSSFNEKYQATRKFCNSALRTAGMTKNNLESYLQTEWDELVEFFDSCTGDPIDPEVNVKRAMANIIRGIVFSKRLPHGEKELDDFSQMVADFFIAMMKGREVEFIPIWLKRMFNTGAETKLNLAKSETERITQYFEELVKEHESSFDERNIRDFLDVCLQHGLQKKGYRHMAHICIALMADATITSVVMMMFVFMYLIHFPQYQHQMRDEIQAVLEETSGGIRLNKRDEMPFTAAFINEVFRIVTPAMTTVQNEPLHATTLRGYHIPKHFQVAVNIYGLHNDPNVFPDPNRFNPHRFLENGKLKNINEFLPFGIGRRKCLGEQMVKSELFFFTANFVNRYNIGPEQPDHLPDLEPLEAGITRANKPFKMVLKNKE